MKVLLGLLTPDAGTISINGRPVVVKDPLAAAAMGIAMVHQHFSVIGALTVWENVTLGERDRLDAERAIRHVTELAERYGLEVDPRARVDTLTPGQRQRVEIVKCLVVTRASSSWTSRRRSSPWRSPPSCSRRCARSCRTRAGRWCSSATSWTRSSTPPTRSRSCGTGASWTACAPPRPTRRPLPAT